MDALRKQIKFIRQVGANEVDYGDLPSVLCLKVMRNLGLWQENYHSASLLAKAMYYLMPTASLIFNASGLTYQLCCEQEKTSTENLEKDILLIIGLVTTLAKIVVQYRQKEYLELAYKVQAERQATVQREDHHLRYRPVYNWIYLFTLVAVIVAGVMTVLRPIPFAMETLLTGELFLKNVLPIEDTPYSLQVYVQCGLQVLLFYWYGLFCVFLAVLILEPLFVCAICYQAIGNDLRLLRKDGTEFTEEGEYQKLRSLMARCTEINELLAITNGLNCYLLSIFIFLCFSLSGLLVTFALRATSVQSTVFYFIQPIGIYSLALIICLLGQYLEDSAGGLQDAIYDCVWYSAPLKFKKLVLMFQIRCQKRVVVDAKPFYRFNLTLITGITIKIFLVYIIARKFL